MVGCALVVRYVALPQHDRLLLATSVGGIVLVLLMVLLVVVCSLLAGRSQTAPLSPLEATCDVPTESGLILRRLGWIPCLQIALDWENVPDSETTLVRRGGGQLAETVVFRRRCHRDTVRRRMSVSDVFGLCQVKRRFPASQSLHVEPQPVPAALPPQVHRDQAGEDIPHHGGQPHGDLIEMRHYRAGDPLKLVLWKHYQRTGQLLVRQPENTISKVEQTIACFIAGRGDEATASVARGLVVELARGSQSLWFRADGATCSTDTWHGAVQQMVQSADHSANGGEVLDHLSEVWQSTRSAHCIVFVPSQDGPWVDRLLGVVASGNMKVQAIMGVQAGEATLTNARLASWIYREEHTHQRSWKDTRVLVDRLAHAGIETRCVDRRGGQSVEPHVTRSAVS